ncbi:putative DNA primase/helicase [Terrimicrobium sacchariphilum]|uniref:Putative DNA primase/helicase n=1 Tax=Terrimicrobium sacchariphilum TaxID=690879 RepID=A0A146G9A5_TERSA|nr:AAA family ATPase [Terrimicrobium sacchariphilum]GAT34060.1 putative DNA primase/helicase [Terrimicrobium sacchariphilum]
MNFAKNWSLFSDYLKSQQASDSARAAGEPPAEPVPEFLRDVAPAAPLAPAPGSMARTLRTVPALGSLDIPERQPVLGDWFMEGDLGFIYAPRGLGKTWFALGMATAITNGTAFGPWQAAARRSILYVDGEMPCQALRARVSGMGAGEGFVVLNHEAYFHLEGGVLNFASPTAQHELTELLLAQGITIVFLDNLSCLFSGMKENDADDWESVLGWLLTLRRHRIAVVVVHHSGRNKETMRGTSRREDAAFWVIRLDETLRGEVSRKGTTFRSMFTKDRNSRTEQPNIEWTFHSSEDGSITIQTKPASSLDTFRQWVADGLTSAEDIAHEMGLTKGAISRLAKIGIEAGWLVKRGREYALR